MNEVLKKHYAKGLAFLAGYLYDFIIDLGSVLKAFLEGLVAK